MSEEIKRNCMTCQYGLFSKCDELKNNVEYQNLVNAEKYDFRKVDDFKRNYICDGYKSIYIEYPIEVSAINTDTAKGKYKERNAGKFAKIAPCAEVYEGKTYLGLYLGELPIGHSISHNSETKELKVSFRTNPAIFVFDLNKIIYGIESYWGIIESEEDLKEITKDDINNIWYVKALKAIIGEEKD